MLLNWVDIVIILVLALSGYFGWRSGFIWLLLDLVALVLAVIGAMLLFQYIAPFFAAGGAGVLIFLLIFFFISAIIGALMRRLYSKVPENVRRSIVNHVLGIPLGLAKGGLIVALAIFALVALPFGINRARITDSYLGNAFLQCGAAVERIAMDFIPSDVREGLTFKTITPSSDKSIDIPARQNVDVDPQAERAMLELVNRERTKRGLNALKIDPELRDVARAHSRDMFRRGYFSHITPNGVDPFERMRRSDVRYTAAGENIALAPTVRIAHEGLMDSPGHRANILRPAFGRIGIGVYKDPTLGKMFTQNFAN